MNIWLGKCFIGVKNILTGGDFEDAFDDDDEADDLEAEMEAIELANSHSAEKTIKSSSNKKKTTQEPDFLFDIPLPTDKIQQTNSIKEEPPHKTETEKSENYLYYRACQKR